jgi:CRP/FNR family transcriptional regulator
MLKVGDALVGHRVRNGPRAQSQIAVVEREQAASPAADGHFLPTCRGCFVREIGACPGFGVKSETEANKSRGILPVPSQIQVFPPRRSILHQREVADYVPVICSGWAASSIVMPNGRKQIVSFLLAGETASMNYFFEPCEGRAIEAVSQVSCRKFRRSDLREAVAKSSALLASLGRTLKEERERSDQLSLDLSRRSAEARIARLILSLVERLRRRGLAQDNSIDFPMRQQQIADATGLTAVHVCKILSRFRASGFIRIDGRRLAVIDQKALQDLVEWQ